jgi:hypothetical protein
MITEYTIEPAHDGFAVIGHGTYDRNSVLEGQPRRCTMNIYRTLAEAQEAYPTAEVLDHSTRVIDPVMSDCAPSDFDPADAGEVWGEDDY